MGTTLVGLGPVPTDVLAGVHGYEPTRRSFKRFYRLHVRTVVFPALDAASQRITDLALLGVPSR